VWRHVAVLALFYLIRGRVKKLTITHMPEPLSGDFKAVSHWLLAILYLLGIWKACYCCLARKVFVPIFGHDATRLLT
jgi:hypothetical protein